jgi:hypothetical protein
LASGTHFPTIAFLDYIDTAIPAILAIISSAIRARFPGVACRVGLAVPLVVALPAFKKRLKLCHLFLLYE